ncbi:M48 family metalloprotease [Luedemannella flava]
MNFFDRQQRVRRMSARLVVLFVLAVIAIVAAVDLAVVFAFNAFSKGLADIAGIVAVTSILTLTAIILAATFRMLGLRGGGGKVARELGGVAVPTDTQDPQLRRLRNVVEEIAIASGTPVPEVYVLPDEAGINAFAAGWNSSSAAVAVTRGALVRLNRDELQGVIAHEFSHVVNGDMRLNIRLMGLLYGILFLAVIGRTLTQFGIIGGDRRDEKSSGNPLAIVGIALLVTGGIGVFAGRLIKASVSRQREYLADASPCSSPGSRPASPGRSRRSPAWRRARTSGTHAARRSGTCSSARARGPRSRRGSPPTRRSWSASRSSSRRSTRTR